MLAVTIIALAYLIGSIPFSYLVGRLFGKTDIRNAGSGNVGATNVARSIGKGAGVLALLLDLAKGYLVVWLTRMIVQRELWPSIYRTDSLIESQSFWIGLASVIAVLGHMYPVWLRFRGGKGVATAAGVFMAIDVTAFAAAGIIFLLVAILTRFVSLGSIFAAASMPLILRFLTGAPFWTVVFSTLIALLIILKHHPNIARLARGEERPFPG